MLEIDLFENISDNEVMELLKCLGIKTKIFKRNSFILKKDSSINYLGIILSGSIKISNLMSKKILKMNDIFGHDIVYCGKTKSPYDIIAMEKSEILFLPFEKIVTPCEKLCKYHLQLIKNVMKMISKQNSILNEKIEVIGQRSIRNKILALLKSYEKEGEIFEIPYSREEMANFLCTDRSALSRELCKMRDEGILKFRKNNFELLK